VSETITYKAGELHALKLSDNTVCLIMPTDYAVTVRDIAGAVTGAQQSRRKYAEMVYMALNRLPDFPESDRSDRTGGTNFKETEAVL
jgi:hypothetical protein